MEQIDILAKTPKGADEIKLRANKLAQKYRSLLIQLDGNATIGELNQRFSGMGDVPALLQTLIEEGYAEIKRPPTAPPVPAPGPAPEVAAPAAAVTVDAQSLTEAVRILCKQLYDLIGPSADDFTGPLEAANTREQFLAAAESCNRMAVSFAGKKKAELFSQRVRYVADRFLPA